MYSPVGHCKHIASEISRVWYTRLLRSDFRITWLCSIAERLKRNRVRGGERGWETTKQEKSDGGLDEGSSAGDRN